MADAAVLKSADPQSAVEAVGPVTVGMAGTVVLDVEAYAAATAERVVAGDAAENSLAAVETAVAALESAVASVGSAAAGAGAAVFQVESAVGPPNNSV